MSDAFAEVAAATQAPPQAEQAEEKFGDVTQRVSTSALFGPLLQAMIQYKGSDLLLSVGTPPRARIDGKLQPLRAEPMTPEEVDECLNACLTAERVAEFDQTRTLDFSFGWGGHSRFRGNAFFAKGHPSLALRFLSGVIPTAESLGMPQSIVNLTTHPHGLVLVTGPTGSGKSTTIAALLQKIIESYQKHIITLEDPIEYEFSHGQSVVNQREIGTDVPTFAEGLRSVLREDPDVVLVGEMRDLESIGMALTTAETGHLVFATLHTNDASQTVDRIIDVFPAGQQRQIRAQLAQALLAVVHQRLLPRREGGRVAAYEVLIANDPVRNLIREGKTNQIKNVIAQSAQEGMMTIESYMAHLQQNGII